MMKELISYKNPQSRGAEAFRTLRTNIQFSNLDDEIKTIVVTSSGPSEGKSTVMCNLAVTMAQSGKKVLLLDCDLRKPTVHKKFLIPNGEGLTNILANNKKIGDVIKILNIPNLFVITSGPTPPNPAELLGSKKMKNVILELKENFDIILIDAPPVLPVTDGQVLSTISDGVILVAAYGKADKGAIVKAKDLITKVGAKVIGVVLNMIPTNSDGYYGKHYYNKYYTKYYGE